MNYYTANFSIIGEIRANAEKPGRKKATLPEAASPF
jgi:hypothetical protein